MFWLLLVKPLCLAHLIGGDGVCPRSLEAKFSGSFLGGKFVGGFDDCAKWITQLVAVFSVGVGDAPKLVARFRGQC